VTTKNRNARCNNDYGGTHIEQIDKMEIPLEFRGVLECWLIIVEGERQLCSWPPSKSSHI
jgi:hypothetical protein